MSNLADIAEHRAALRRIDEALTVVEVGVDSSEAAGLVGRERANVRAAEQSLAAAAREILAPAGSVR